MEGEVGDGVVVGGVVLEQLDRRLLLDKFSIIRNRQTHQVLQVIQVLHLILLLEL